MAVPQRGTAFILLVNFISDFSKLLMTH